MREFGYKYLKLFAIYKIKMGGNVHFTSDKKSFFPGRDVVFMLLQKGIRSPYHIRHPEAFSKVLNLNDMTVYYMYIFASPLSWKDFLELVTE